MFPNRLYHAKDFVFYLVIVVDYPRLEMRINDF
ncbi:hypothetical protein LAUMK15_05733 [Mycobacterium persicum]|nr:hypothetical protein LAUMK15_05733 [Mycobacterium persicum]